MIQVLDRFKTATHEIRIRNKKTNKYSTISIVSNKTTEEIKELIKENLENGKL